ncbi:MAG: HAD hydrolase family protein, partial [Halobacteriovoraceae bacterium]|nr:HAD hydrolase family protein [Halobacteriovoraceae bacterium]
GFAEEEIFYMGDEFFDLPLLKRAGFSATASHASWEIKETVDYVAKRPAGQACARELIDIIRYAHAIDVFSLKL